MQSFRTLCRCSWLSTGFDATYFNLSASFVKAAVAQAASFVALPGAS